MVALKPAMGSWAGMGTYLNPLALLGCALGLVFLRGTSRRAMLPLLFAGITLLVFAAFGASSSALASLQPNRFIAPAFLLIGTGAAYCLGEYATQPQRTGHPAIKLLLVSGLCVIGLYSGREMIREASAGQHGHYGKTPPELTAAPSLVAQLESWIAANTSVDGRIVFETSLGRVHGGGHVAGVIALKTGRELLGAAYPYLLPSVSFWDRVAFGKPVSEVTPAQLQQGFEIYNVGWVVAHSPELQHAMAALPAASEVARFDFVRIYKISRPLSYVYAGTGRIAERGFNRLRVVGAAGPDLILKYHWVPGLTVSPPATIDAVKVSPDFPPFVRVRHPSNDFTLSLCSHCVSK